MTSRRMWTLALGTVLAVGTLLAPSDASARGRDRDCDDNYRSRRQHVRYDRYDRSSRYDRDNCRPSYRQRRYEPVSYSCGGCRQNFSERRTLIVHRERSRCH